MLVRANVAPLRRLTLLELAEEIAERFNSDLVKLKIEPQLDKDFVRTIAVPHDVSNYLVTEILRVTRKYTLRFKKEKILGRDDSLSIFNDLLVYAIKYAPIPDFLKVEELRIPAAQDIFYTFYLLNEEPTLEKLLQFMEDLSSNNEKSKFIKVYKILTEFKEVVAPLAELALYLLPADTRPGLNVSSLFSHMLITSAALVAKCGSEVERTCALLHDIGKVKNPKRHTREAETFLKDIIDILDEKYEEVLECIKSHHSETGNKKVKEADWFAASTDRISTLYNVFEKELRNILGEGYEIIKKTFESPSFKEREDSYEWIERNTEKVKKASEFVASKLLLSKPDEFIRLKKRLEELEDKRKIPINISLLVVDIGGIQETLGNARKLRILSGTSYLVELITHVIVPYEIMKKFNVKPENIIFSGGGTVHAIVRNRSKGDKDLLLSLDNYLPQPLFGSLKLRLGMAEVNKPFAIAVEEAYNEIRNNKIKEMSDIPRKSFILIEAPKAGAERCSWCQRRIATVDAGGEKVCLRCYALWKITSPFGYSEKSIRMKMLKKLIGDEASEERAIDFLREGEYVSFVAADGNFMGLLMSTSLSPSIYQEKSLRVDLATKRSLLRILSALDDINKVKLVLGFLYAGGDDFNAVLSPSLGLLVGASFAYSFSAELGKVVSTSVGIATARYTAPIWDLREAAEELMESVKGATRSFSFECMTGKNECSGFLAAAFVQGMATRWMVEDVFEEVYQGIPIRAEDLLRALGELLGEGVNEYEIEGDEEMNRLMHKLLEDISSLKNRIKELRKELSKISASDELTQLSKLFYYISKDPKKKDLLKVLLKEPFYRKGINLMLFDIVYKHLSRG